MGRLAVSFGDQPDIFPVNFIVDHGTIVFRTAEGTKLAAAVLGRGVAFEVDGYDADAGEAWSVVVKGHATEIERMQDVFDALDLPLFPWHAAPSTASFASSRDDISGRRFEVVDASGVAQLFSGVEPPSLLDVSLEVRLTDRRTSIDFSYRVVVARVARRLASRDGRRGCSEPPKVRRIVVLAFGLREQPPGDHRRLRLRADRRCHRPRGLRP